MLPALPGAFFGRWRCVTVTRPTVLKKIVPLRMCRGLLFMGLLTTYATASLIAQPTKATQYSNTLVVRNLDNTSGLAGSLVQEISQDRQGYIRIGTEKGLQCYGGLR